ncbi:hypothetical protein OKW42_001461 [Paraburkholderia sp. WC7.3d]
MTPDKHEADPRELLACVIAMGTNMWLRKMAEVHVPFNPTVFGAHEHDSHYVCSICSTATPPTCVRSCIPPTHTAPTR